MVILTIILMDILTGMEFDLFVPSFPELKDYFDLSAFWVASSLSVNFIGYCISLFLVGELADHYGRKSIILIGLLIFIIGSTLCLMSQTYFIIFLVGRFMQGLGIAAPAILSFLIVADSYPIKQQQFLISMLNAVMNISVAAAPVIGSFITKQFHWHGNFIALLLLGIIIFLMSVIFVPLEKISNKKPNLWQGYTTIFKSNIIMLLIIYFILMFVPYWIFVGMSPLLYIKDLGVSLIYFGYYQGSLALSFALGSLLFGFIVTWANQKKMLVFANVIFIASVASILLAAFKHASAMYITLAFLPFVIGQIIPSNVLYPLYLNLLPEAKGRLTAIIQGGRLIVASLGLQIAGYFYTSTFCSIGIILASVILMGIIVLFVVIKQWDKIELNNSHG